MLIRLKRTHKDAICHSHGHHRREGLPPARVDGGDRDRRLSKTMIKDAMAALPPRCPSRCWPRGLAQIFSEGAPPWGPLHRDDQATSMNATMAANYGISGQANLVSTEPPGGQTSPFGATLPRVRRATPAPSGRPCSPGSAAAAPGQFNQDDGGGVDTGLLGGAARSSRRRSARTSGSPTATSWRPGPTGFPRAWSRPRHRQPRQGLQPDAGGGTFTNSSSMTASADAATALGQVLTRVFGIDKRKAAPSCWVRRAAASTDPRAGGSQLRLNLFTPATSPPWRASPAPRPRPTPPGASSPHLQHPGVGSPGRLLPVGAGWRRGIHRVLRPRLPW